MREPRTRSWVESSCMDIRLPQVRGHLAGPIMKKPYAGGQVVLLNEDQVRAVLSYELIPRSGRRLGFFCQAGASNKRRPSALHASTASTCLDTTFSRTKNPIPKGLESA